MDLRLATVGLATIAISYPSIEQENFSNVGALKANVDMNSQKCYLVVVFSGVNKRRLKNDFKELQQKSNVFAIYICVKSKRNGIAGIDNSCLVTGQFLRYQLIQSIIDFFEKSINSLHNEKVFLGIQMKMIIDEMKRQRQSMIAPFNPCDVLIIPMNVGDDIQYTYLSKIIDVCNDLSPDCDSVVYLLDNYASLYEKFNDNEHSGILCEYVKKMGPIRLYLFGNEQNCHEISKSLYESDNFRELPCDQYCARVEYEPVTESTRSHALKNYTELQQANGIRFQRIDDIKNDTCFLKALDCVQISRDNRQLVATNRLNQHDFDSIQFSSEHRSIGQPDVSSNGLTDGEEINTSIQC